MLPEHPSDFLTALLTAGPAIQLIILLLSGYFLYTLQDGARQRLHRYRLGYQQQKRQSLQLYRFRRQGQLLKLWLCDPDGRRLPAIKPGQHLLLSGEDLAGTPLSRAYSVCSDSRQRRFYQLTIKIEAAGRLTPALAQQLQQGQILQTGYPAGHFQLTPRWRQFSSWLQPRALVLVAGGIGITPLLPMVSAALRQGRPVTLFVQARRAGDLLQHAKLRRLPGLHYLPYLTQPDPDWTGCHGRLTAAQIVAFGGLAADYYLCANANMVQQLEQGLRAVGCQRIYHELFSAANSTARLPIQLGAVTADSLGHASVLDALLAAGAAVPYDCRGGSCGACRIRLISGQCQQVLAAEFPLPADEVLACCVQALSPLQLQLPQADISLTPASGQQQIASPYQNLPARPTSSDNPG